MSWPTSRFEAIYKAMIQRQAVESIEEQRNAMTAALFANPNWDDSKNDREGRLKELNENYDQAITAIYFPDKKDGDEIDWDNPFYAAAKRGLERTRQQLGLEEGKQMRDVVEMDEEQLRAREASRNAIDQV